jgi:hypothetical protein
MGSPTTSVSMPRLGEDVGEGTVTRWLKQEGEQVEVDEPLLEVSTDKVDTEISSPAAGVLSRILVAEDETVEVGAELAVIGSAQAGGGAPAPAPAGDGGERYVTPLVQRLAAERGVDLSSVTGTGVGGRIRKQDVIAAAENAAALAEVPDQAPALAEVPDQAPALAGVPDQAAALAEVPDQVAAGAIAASGAAQDAASPPRDAAPSQEDASSKVTGGSAGDEATVRSRPYVPLPRGKVKVSFNLWREEVDRLRRLAEGARTTKTAALQRAIADATFFAEETGRGARVLLRYPNGEYREVIMRR